MGLELPPERQFSKDLIDEMLEQSTLWGVHRSKPHVKTEKDEPEKEVEWVEIRRSSTGFTKYEVATSWGKRTPCSVYIAGRIYAWFMIRSHRRGPKIKTWRKELT